MTSTRNNYTQGSYLFEDRSMKDVDYHRVLISISYSMIPLYHNLELLHGTIRGLHRLHGSLCLAKLSTSDCCRSNPSSSMVAYLPRASTT